MDTDASVLAPAGPAARLLAQWVQVLLVAGIALFVLVFALALWSLRGGGVRSARSERRWIVGGGVVLPLVVLLPLAAATLRHGAGIAGHPPPDAVFVAVTGHMWWWEVRVLDARTGREAVLANELVLPVGRAVRVSLTSADVIHAFWIPALGGKRDALPGRIAQVDLLADRPGRFHAPCAEFCGPEHAHMALAVTAVPPADFERWLAGQFAPAAEPPDALAAQGRAAFLAQRCDACHALRGVGGEPPGVAPDLTHVGSRSAIGGGRLAMRDGVFSTWLREIHALKPAARMPSYAHLDAATLDALDAYLRQLQ